MSGVTLESMRSRMYDSGDLPDIVNDQWSRQHKRRNTHCAQLMMDKLRNKEKLRLKMKAKLLEKQIEKQIKK